MDSSVSKGLLLYVRMAGRIHVEARLLSLYWYNLLST